MNQEYDSRHDDLARICQANVFGAEAVLEAGS
jgi:hypothetical protein